MSAVDLFDEMIDWVERHSLKVTEDIRQEMLIYMNGVLDNYTENIIDIVNSTECELENTDENSYYMFYNNERRLEFLKLEIEAIICDKLSYEIRNEGYISEGLWEVYLELKGNCESEGLKLGGMKSKYLLGKNTSTFLTCEEYLDITEEVITEIYEHLKTKWR